MRSLRAREGDFVETIEGSIFDVKGFLHPPERIVAYLRYLPDAAGDRVRANEHYRKVYSLVERAGILEEKWPTYLYFDRIFNERVQAVPLDKIQRHYDPIVRLTGLLKKERLDRVEQAAIELVEVLKSATGLPYGCFGISGSLLVDLHTPTSDVDPIIYGVGASKKIYEAMNTLVRQGIQFQTYDRSDLLKLYEARSMGAAMSFDTFAKHELRKVLEGKFRGRDYFIRCVKNWDEIEENYGDKIYYPAGRMTIQAIVEDDSEHMFTPCKYEIRNPRILEGKSKESPTEIVSFRGRFCEQTFNDESIVACGKLEKVVSEEGKAYRLVVGEDSSDFLRAFEA